MIQIRQQQFEAMIRPAVETWIARHLDCYFPAHRIAYPGERFDEFVRHVIARAAFHGFTVGSHIAHWANLMAVFGERFDEAPEHEWVRTILKQQNSPGVKMNLLLEAAERVMPGKN